MLLDDEKFDEMVKEAWEQIPGRFQEEIENVSILIERRPTEQQIGRLKVKGALLGLFLGVPKIAWGQAVMGVQPSTIILFQESILECSRDIRELEDTIKVVLMHEVGHYFGYNEEEMFIMDRRLRKRLSNKA